MEYNLTKIFNFFLKYGLILSLTIGLYLFLNWRRRRWEKGWQDIWQKPFGRNGDTGIYLSWPSESLRRLFYMGTDFQITAMDLIIISYDICAMLLCYAYIIANIIYGKSVKIDLLIEFWAGGLMLSMNIGMFWKILYFMKKTKTINKDLGLQVFNLGMTMLLTLATLSIILLEIFGILL